MPEAAGPDLVADPDNVGLAAAPVAGAPDDGAPEGAEFPGALAPSEPGAPMVLTIVCTEVATDVGLPGTGATDEAFAGADPEPELGDPGPALPPPGAVAKTVRTLVSVEPGTLPVADGPELGLSLGPFPGADVTGRFPGAELSAPTDVTTVTKEGEAETGPPESEGPADGNGAGADEFQEPPAPGPPTVSTVVEPGLAGELGPAPGAPMVVALVTFEGSAALGDPDAPGAGADGAADGRVAMMVMTDGTGPPIVVTIVMGGGGPEDEPAPADRVGSGVAMTVITDGVGPSMVVMMVIGGGGPAGVPGAEGSAEGAVGAPALAVTVTGGGGTAGLLEFDGTGRAGLDREDSAITVVTPGDSELGGAALAGLLDGAVELVVKSGIDIDAGSVELAGVLGRAVLETMSVVHSSLVPDRTDLELLITVLLELIDDDEEEVVFDVLQTPGEATPK